MRRGYRQGLALLLMWFRCCEGLHVDTDALLQIDSETGAAWATLDASRVSLALSAFQLEEGVECVGAEWDGPLVLSMRPIIVATWEVSATFPWTPASSSDALIVAQGDLSLTATRVVDATPPAATCRLNVQSDASFCVTTDEDATTCACVPGFFFHLLDAGCTPCPVGTFKAAVGNSAACDACPSGWSSLAGRPRCFPCPVGTWGNALGVCVPCRLHSRMSAADEEGRRTPCECMPGAYPSYHDPNLCVTCAPGTYSPSGAGCHMCMPGTSAAASGQTACDVCPYQPSAGATECARCPLEWMVPDTTNGTRCVCATGAWLDVMGATCAPCPPGTWSPSPAEGCMVCPPWTASSQTEGATACDQCATDAALDGDVCRPVRCGPGTFRIGSTAECAPCPMGTYDDNAPMRLAGADEPCTPCPDHMTTLAPGALVCVCAPDTQLTKDDGRCVPCGPGTWGAVYGECEPCPAGTFRDVYVFAMMTTCMDCAAGTYSPGGGASACGACGAGAYAEEGRTSCAPCAPGSASSALAVTQCEACAPGTFALLAGADEPCTPCPDRMTTLAPGALGCVCAPNMRLTEDDGRCVPCGHGTWGAVYGECEPCPIGTFRDVYVSTTCMGCAVGTYAPGRGASTCGTCGSGAYAEEGRTSCALCAPGSSSSASAVTQCEACAPGTYADTEGRFECATCAYQPSSGATACMECPAFMTPSSSSRTRCVCAAGAMPDSIGATCAPCFSETYKATAGDSPCLLCPPWSTTTTTGGQSVCGQCIGGAVRVRGECRACGPGFFQSDPSAATCQQCAPGSFSPLAGATVCMDCGSGSYADMEGAIACAPCPLNSHTTSAEDGGSHILMCDCLDGFLRDLETQTCVPCPFHLGYVQLDAGAGQCVPCPIGTYHHHPLNDIITAQCVPCPIGTYAATPGTITECQPCPPFMTTRSVGGIGCYCMVGAPLDTERGVCVPCAAGSSWLVVGVVDDADWQCAACPAGTYSGAPMATACMACPDGTAAPWQGMTACLECGLWVTADRTACHCRAGNYWNGTLCVDCAPGCAPGSYMASECVHEHDLVCSPCASAACPNGTFAISECTPFNDRLCWPCRDSCGEGAFIARPCSARADVACLACRAACPPGQPLLEAPCSATSDRVCAPCPAGTYALLLLGDCTPCPPGTVAPYAAMTACVACPIYADASATACVSTCAPGSFPGTPQTCERCPPGSTSAKGDVCVAHAPALLLVEVACASSS